MLVLFLLSYKYLHVEENLEVDDSCPICTFEKTARLFYAVSCALLYWISLYMIFSKIYSRENQHESPGIRHILGQRAPPFTWQKH